VLCKSVGTGSVLTPKKRLEANGRDERDFIALSPAVTMLIAMAFLHFLPVDP